MNSITNKIFRPNIVILIFYGILSLVCLIAYVWRFSFLWEYFFRVNHFIAGLLVILVIGLLIAINMDKKFGSQLKRYLFISLAQLIIIWSVANPIRVWQINSSIEKAQLIIESLEIFKEQNDKYPISLTELGVTLNKDLPSRTNIGTEYEYKKNSELDYRLWFFSYYGYTAYYNIKKGEWFFTD